MNRIATVTRYLDNLANPILVKEMRQAVKGKFLIIVMGLILVAQLIIWWLITLNNTFSNVTGRDAYIWMLSLFGCALGITMPVYAGFRILSERARQDLLYVSALSPFQIIWGKFLAAASLILIVFTTFLPFFYLTLLIGGIDMWTITYSLIVVVMALLGGVMFTILALCAVVPILVKIFLVIVTLFGLYMIGTMAVVTLIMIFAEDMYIASDWERFFATLSWLIGGPVVIGLLIVLAACAISPSSSNRAFIPRVYATVAVLISVPFTMISFYSTLPPGLSTEFMAISLYAEGIILFWAGIIFLLVSASGRFKYGIRLRRQIPTGKYKRLLAFPFYSGAANGVIWSLMFTGLSFLCFGLLMFYPDTFFFNPANEASVFHFLAFFNSLAIYDWLGMILTYAFGMFRPGLWSILLCGFVAGVTSVMYLSLFDMADESVLILLPNAPFFFQSEIYVICFGSGIVNVLTGSFVLSQIIVPQTRQFFEGDKRPYEKSEFASKLEADGRAAASEESESGEQEIVDEAIGETKIGETKEENGSAPKDTDNKGSGAEQPSDPDLNQQ